MERFEKDFLDEADPIRQQEFKCSVGTVADEITKLAWGMCELLTEEQCINDGTFLEIYGEGGGQSGGGICPGFLTGRITEMLEKINTK